MSGLKSEVTFGTDNFNNQKVLSSEESLAQILLNLLLMRPGNMPGLPHLGINIRQYLYSFTDEIDVDGLKNKIYSQSSELLPYLITGDIKIANVQQNGQNILIIAIPIPSQNNDDAILFGFSKNADGTLTANYQIDKQLLSY